VAFSTNADDLGRLHPPAHGHVADRQHPVGQQDVGQDADRPSDLEGATPPEPVSGTPPSAIIRSADSITGSAMPRRSVSPVPPAQRHGSRRRRSLRNPAVACSGYSAFAEHDSFEHALQPLQPEHKQHGLVALLAQFRRQIVAALGDVAQAGQDRNILLAPPPSNVIGGALKPVPTLIFHTWSSVLSSKAAKVPSVRP